MKHNYEKFKPNKKKLAKWQWATIIGGGSLFLIATIVFIVLFAENIFSENTFVWCIAALLLAFFIGGFIYYFACVKKED